jgi:regulator of protease activity HflC (stomatin/prohibitin superfamily)
MTGESAFAWVQGIVEWVGQFFPRWIVVDTTHGWVKWVKGSRVETGGAGIVWHWPATTNFVQYPVVRQATELPTQTMETTDGKTIVVGTLIVYEIKDLRKILAETYDPEQTIKDLAQGAIHDVCSMKAWADLKAPKLDLELRREVAKRLEPFGVRVLRTTFTNLARTRVLKIVQSNQKEG